MNATIRYVLLTAIRDRFMLAIVLALLAMVGLCKLLAASALLEGQQLGLAYGGELSRLILVLGLSIFISFHVRRLHETREIEAILARPISRGGFVIGYFAGFSAVALLLAVVDGPLMMAGLGASGGGFLEWEASLLLEVLIVVAVALFAAMAVPTPAGAVLVTIGLYGLGRLGAYLLAIAHAGTGAADQEGLNQGTNAAMWLVAALMPRLDLFGQSVWLTGGGGASWGIGLQLLQVAIYVPLLLIATIRDLHVKTF